MTSQARGDHSGAINDLSAPVPGVPEDRQVFRLAQLALLLQVAGDSQASVRTVDRLGVYDFFAANPFAVTAGNERRDEEDRLALRLAGFTDRQLSYASTGQRFASRRRRLQHDLSLLLAYGLTVISSEGYVLTPLGKAIAEGLTSVYADAYREAAQVVLRRLGRLTDQKLAEHVEKWLGQDWLLIDLLDDVAETTPNVQSNAPREA
jgi:hypothetical protein